MQSNILVFFTDQQRWDMVDCYNPVTSTTPVLGQLAHEGVKSENALTVQPVCGPARSCLQTGRYPTQNGCYRNNIVIRQDEVTPAKLFNQTGYDTAYIGKWHPADLDKKPMPEKLRGGWQYWLATDALERTSHPYGGHFFDNDDQPMHFGGYRVDDQTSFALDYLQNRQRGNPFPLFLSYLEPHFQNDMACFVAPDGYAECFQIAAVSPDLINHPGDWSQNPPDYHGMCQNLDENLGHIIDYLKAGGEYDNTIILSFSDHDCHFRTRNDKYKRSCHEFSIRIPCVVRGGPFSGGKTVEHLVTLLDIPVTVLSAVGITVPEAMVGYDLQTALDAGDWEEEVLIQIGESGVGRVLRTTHWKYEIVTPGSDPWNESAATTYVESQLYDLLNDPWERQNLIASPEYAWIRDKLRQNIGRRMMLIGEDLPVIIPAEQVVTAWMIVALCGYGMVTSLLSALLDVGGSILLVSVLHLLFPQCTVQTLAATFLMVVMLSVLINIYVFWRQGTLLNTRLLVSWSLDMVTRMQVGVYASSLLSDKVLLMLFALVLVGLVLRCGHSRQTTRKNVQPDSRTRSTGMLLCTADGAVAGLIGLGGGFVLAPLMSQLSGIPRQHITVHCSWMMLFGSAETVVNYLYRTVPDVGALPAAMQFDYVNMVIMAAIFLCTLAFQPISMRLRTLLSECWLQRVFSSVLLMIATLILATL